LLLRLALVIDRLASSCRSSTSSADRAATSINESALAHVKALWLTIHLNLIAVLAHEGIWIDLLLDLLLFLLALEVLAQVYSFLVHEARPDAWLNRLHGSGSTVLTLIVNAAIVISWLVEVHACGVRVWRVEGVGWQRLLLLIQLLCKWRLRLLEVLLTEVRWLMN